MYLKAANKMNSASLNPANAACLICGNHAEITQAGLFDTRFGIPASYSIARCGACGLEQTIPLPSPEEIKSLYETYYNFCGESGTLYTRLRSLFLSSLLYRLWMRIDGDISFHARPGSGRLLDVGCNEGRGLAIYGKNGFSAEGLELNENAANVARAQGFVVHTQLVECFDPAELYDVVVLSNVLEHSLEPTVMMAHVNRLLRPGGQVWISCPNSNSFLRTLFGKFWLNWHLPFHISHFTVATLSGLLMRTGFDSLELRQRTPALWVAQSIITRLFARNGTPTSQLRNPGLVVSLMLAVRGLLFPLLWLCNTIGSGDCLICVARKK